jgi:hypothetical protein
VQGSPANRRRTFSYFRFSWFSSIATRLVTCNTQPARPGVQQLTGSWACLAFTLTGPWPSQSLILSPSSASLRCPPVIHGHASCQSTPRVLHPPLRLIEKYERQGYSESKRAGSQETHKGCGQLRCPPAQAPSTPVAARCRPLHAVTGQQGELRHTQNSHTRMSTKGSRRSSAKGEEGKKKAKRHRNGKARANVQRDAEPRRRLASCSPSLQLSHTRQDVAGKMC